MWLDPYDPYLVVKGGTAKEPKAHDLAGDRQDWTPHWVDSMENKRKPIHTKPLFPLFILLLVLLIVVVFNIDYGVFGHFWLLETDSWPKCLIVQFASSFN